MSLGTSDPGSYAHLLASMQPRSIRGEEDADAIQSHIDTLIDKGELSSEEQEILSLLGDLTMAWEGNRYDLPDMAPVAVIHELIDAHGMRQRDLVGPVFPTKSIASEVLSGKRRLTYRYVDKLARFFSVSPAVFFPSGSRADVA